MHNVSNKLQYGKKHIHQKIISSMNFSIIFIIFIIIYQKNQKRNFIFSARTKTNCATSKMLSLEKE